MILVDANLLIYAVDAGSPHHAAAKIWWSRQLSETAPVCLDWQVLLAFVRITTNPRMVLTPLTFEETVTEVERWLAQPCVRLITATATHWQTFKRTLRAASPSSSLINDGHLAALAIERDCEVLTSDSDFARFPGVRWRNPLTGAASPTS